MAGYADAPSAVLRPPPRPPLEVEDDGREQNELQGECGGQRTVKKGLVLDVNGAGEGAVAQQRHRPKVAQGVQGDHQATRHNGGAQLGQNDAPEGGSRTQSQAPRRFQLAWVEPAQGGAGGQVHIGVADEG